jgi:hypothetical protein
MVSQLGAKVEGATRGGRVGGRGGGERIVIASYWRGGLTAEEYLPHCGQIKGRFVGAHAEREGGGKGRKLQGFACNLTMSALALSALLCCCSYSTPETLSCRWRCLCMTGSAMHCCLHSSPRGTTGLCPRQHPAHIAAAAAHTCNSKQAYASYLRQG